MKKGIPTTIYRQIVAENRSRVSIANCSACVLFVELMYFADLLDLLLDAFKLQTSFLQMVFNHTQFIECIIESASDHQDTALVRGALLTLESLCDSESGADHLMAFNVLDAVCPLLQHQCDLIRKYDQSLNFQNDKLRKFAQIKVNECQSKWQNCRFATNDFIQQQMFENIHKKLVKV